VINAPSPIFTGSEPKVTFALKSHFSRSTSIISIEMNIKIQYNILLFIIFVTRFNSAVNSEALISLIGIKPDFVKSFSIMNYIE